MNCLSINIQGLVSKAKKDWIKGLNNFHKVTFLSIQETKMDSISETEIKALWDNYRFEYILVKPLVHQEESYVCGIRVTFARNIIFSRIILLFFMVCGFLNVRKF